MSHTLVNYTGLTNLGMNPNSASLYYPFTCQVNLIKHCILYQTALK